MVVTAIVLGCNDQVGPVNITRQEGEDNVIIHCPFSTSSTPIWRINSMLYEPLPLRLPLMPTKNGISISVVDMIYNNTSFQCFTPNGNGLDVCKSSTGTLTVTKSGKDY